MEGQEGHEWQEGHEGHEGHEGQEGQEGHVHKLEFLPKLFVFAVQSDQTRKESAQKCINFNAVSHVNKFCLNQLEKTYILHIRI